MSTTCPPAPIQPADSEAIRRALMRITATESFQNSLRSRRFLEYVVRRALEGRAAEIKEYAIGVDVFDRGAGFDPKTDSIVRYEARRLRAKLHEYYVGPGANEPVRIQLPKGGYVPEFEWREVPPVTATPTKSPAPGRFGRRWPVAIGALAAGLVAASGIVFWRSRQPVQSPSIFVLPFANRDATTRYLSEGLTEEIQEGLARVPGLRVLVNAPAGMDLAAESDYRALGRKLGVAAILAGEFTQHEGSLWVRYRLVRTADGSLLAAGSRGAPAGALAGIDSSMVTEVAHTLHLPSPASEPGTRNQEASDLYMQGRYLWHTRVPRNVFQAIRLYDRALTLDPGYAGPYTGLADAYGMEVANGQMDPADGLSKGLAAAKEALRRDPDSAEAHTAAGLLHYSQWHWADAEREYRAAVALDPNYGIVYHRLAMLAYAFGHFEDSERFYEKGRAVDPFSLSIPESEAQLYYYWKRPDRAIALCRQIQSLSPTDIYAHEALARAYYQKRDFADAYREAQLFYGPTSSDPRDSAGPAGILPYLAGWKGHAAAAPIFAVIEQQAAKGRFVNELDLATGAIAAGDRQKSLQYLKSAYQHRVTDLVSIRFDPFFDELHGDPEFEKIFHDMGVTGTESKLGQ